MIKAASSIPENHLFIINTLSRSRTSSTKQNRISPDFCPIAEPTFNILKMRLKKKKENKKKEHNLICLLSFISFPTCVLKPIPSLYRGTKAHPRASNISTKLFFFLFVQVQAPFYPFNNTYVEDFVVGSESCNSVKGYCNGPLKAASAYRIKIRAFTTPSTFTDTVFSYPIRTGKYFSLK